MTATPDWLRMIDAHATPGIPTKPRTPEDVAVRQAVYERPETTHPAADRTELS